MDLPIELKKSKDVIEEHARGYGLDFFETIFELLSYDELNAIASYGGFPVRYPHWRFGMEYEELSKGYEYGLQKIYELVINNDPCYAYLMDCNNLVDQKLVMAHVYAHCDFFKNNLYFEHTNRKMLDQMANNAIKIRRYIEKYGEDRVSNFIDICLSLENLIDPHSVAIKRGVSRSEESDDSVQIHKLKSKKTYMEDYINPKEFITQQKDRLEKDRKRKKRFPEEPQRDILKFLVDYAPLKQWQRNILGMIREEAYYFSPQGATKIMNEGWASYFHSKIMTEKVLNDSEVIDYADHHSGTLLTGTGRLNPYKLGIELFRDIKDRWDKGRFGKEWEECDDIEIKNNWNKKTGLGTQKIFEVRKLYNDVAFIDTFLTAEFCQKQKLFGYSYNSRNNMYEISDREFKAIKQKILFSLTNFGQPVLRIYHANFKNRNELYVVHEYEGIPLKMDEARRNLRNLFKIWKRPVHLETQVNDEPLLVSFDGKETTESDVIDPDLVNTAFSGWLK